jgi:hypothetical protein
VLLRSDGRVVACGRETFERCNIPCPGHSNQYHADVQLGRDLVLQLELFSEGDAVTLICSDLAGKEALYWKAPGSDSSWESHKHIAREMKVNLQNLRVVLPDGQLLANFCHANPASTLLDASRHCQQRFI